MNRLPRRSLLAASLAAALTSGIAIASNAPSAEPVFAASEQARGETYIVLFDEPGLLHNDGTRSTFAATSPEATGTRKLDVNSSAAVAYRSFLRSQQDAHLQAIAATLGRTIEPGYRYDVTDSGVAFTMTASEAARVAGLPGIKHVRPAGTFELSGDRQPFFIGADSVWSGAAAPVGTPTNVLRGQGVVVGIVDSGINTTHPSFAPMGAECGFATSTPKLLLARNCLGDANCTPGASGEDLNGHGSHVAATAAGNMVPAGSVSAGPPLLPATTVQGVAPCASIISYRVCEQSSCNGAAIFAAFQSAIADQVDVINFSISGGTNPWNDNDRLKLDAVAADIFVAASAGNTGTTITDPIGTVNHRGPWVMAVGNSTDDRPGQGANARIRLTVASPAPTPPLNGELVAYSVGVPLVAENNREIRFSSANPLGCSANGGYPAGFFANSIALIQRGTCTFEEKLNNAQAAGAVGGIIFNNTTGVPAFIAGAATLPSAALEQTLGEALRNFIVANGATPTLINVTVASRLGGVLNASSLRGPNNSFDVTKPDITGPGTNVYDAYIGPSLFAFLTGTSMSGPHIAGGAALVRAVRPTWTPMEVHSALMMTANRDQWLPDVITPATPDDVGTGMIDLRRAPLAGFVLNETFANFLAANPANGGNPRTLNLASMRNTNCVGFCVFNRTIRNTITQATSWTATITAPTGITIDPIAPFAFTGSTTETLTIPVIVRIAPGTTLSTTQFAEIRFTEAGDLSPPLVWTVAIRGSNPAPADELMSDGFEQRL
jgi:subtilisin family serine protease